MTATQPAEALVAGVGFVGSYILAEADNAGLAVCGVDLHPTNLAGRLADGSDVRVHSTDLRDREATRRLLKDVSPRTLVITSRLEDNDGLFSPLQFLIDSAASVGTSQIIVISSLAVYGTASAHGGLSETSRGVDPSSYGLNKLAEERTAAMAAQNAGVSCLILRSSGLFGRLPAPRFSNRSAGAIDRVLRQHLAGEHPILSVEDAPDQYLYSRELGAVVAEALRRPPPFDVMNIGPGHVLEPDRVREILESVLGVKIALRRCDRTGPAIQALNVDRLDTWYPERSQARSEFTLGVSATMRDFGIGPSNESISPDPRQGTAASWLW
jgi:nucleoside-diphosphate-sugar epimerase